MKLFKISALALAIGCVVAVEDVRPARGQGVAALTVGQIVQSVESLAKELENGAQALIQQGNTALAQQQMLAAGILRQLIVQLSETYKGRLDDTFQSISGAQANFAFDVDRILEQVKTLKEGSVSDVQNTVYKLQGSVNQLVNKLPFTSREPAFYGMIVRDIYSEIASAGFDLELAGLNLTDPKLGFKMPAISVDGELVPAERISVQEDRIQVALPEAVRQKAGISKDFCSPRRPFVVELTSYYKTDKQFLFIDIGQEASVKYRAFALPSPDTLQVKTQTEGITRTQSDQSGTFSKDSGSVTVGCEENNSGSTRYTVPDGAKEVNCSAAWVNTSNIKTQSASCAVGGSTITASGTLRGKDRQCIVTDIISGGIIKAIVGRKTACNCPGGGHATLRLNGTYKTTLVTETPFVDVSIPKQEFTESADLVLPSDSSKRITKINADIRRPLCDKPLDEIVLNLPTDPAAVASQTSQKGLFRATFRNQRLQLEKIEK